MASFINEDLTLDSNADNDWTRLYDPNNVLVDLTAYTAKLEIKINKTDVSALLTLTDVSGLTLGGTAGSVAIAITQAQSTTLAASMPGGAGFYDLLLIDGSGKVTRFMQGAIIIDQGVTTE